MQLDTYQEQVHKHFYPQGADALALGLFSKMGKLSARIADNRTDDLDKELGEVLRYLAELCNELGYSLNMIADADLKALWKIDGETL